MERQEIIRVAKEHVAAKIVDILVKNYNSGGGALETEGTFTALLEAFKAIEIAEKFDTDIEHKKDVEDYHQGIIRNVE